MKGLEDYINSNTIISQNSLQTPKNTKNINEGVWDTIVKWFDKFFSSSDKQFDRYNDDPINSAEYTLYLKNHFRKRDLKIKKINNNVLSSIISPNGIDPDEVTETGFWDFLYEPTDTNSTFYAVIYENRDCKDVAALIKVNEDTGLYNNCAEIIKIQIINEFQNYLSIEDVINQLENKLGVSHNGLFVKRNINKNLYQYVLNDCGFERTRYKIDINIAYKIFNEANI